MKTRPNLNKLLNNPSLEPLKTLTLTLNNGGAVTFQIQDALEFVFSNKFTNEVEFLVHLSQTNSLTQEALECFFKHMMYDKRTARSFVQWQRKKAFL